MVEEIWKFELVKIQDRTYEGITEMLGFDDAKIIESDKFASMSLVGQAHQKRFAKDGLDFVCK